MTSTIGALAPAPEWEPLYWTRPIGSYTLGLDVEEFARDYIRLSRGFKVGSPFEMDEWQKWLVQAILETDSEGLLRYRKCIVGLPRKNGKSLLASTVGLWFLVFGGEGQTIFSLAKDRPQAKIVFDEAKQQVLQNPFLSKVIRVTKDVLEHRYTNSTWRALASDGGSNQGLAPSIVIVDELHVFSEGRGADSWAALTEGSGDRKESLVVAISTAGATMDSLLGRLVQYGVDIINGEIEDEQFGLFWWGAPDDADVFDEEVWKRANPNLACGNMSLDDFRASLNQGLASPNGPVAFMRYRLNIWVPTAHGDFSTAFLTPALWDERAIDSTIPVGAEITLGFDGSLTSDSTAFVAMDVNTGVTETLFAWDRPAHISASETWMVPRDEVVEAKKQIFQSYNVVRFWADDSYFQTDFQAWIAQHEEGVVQRIPQSNARMIPLAAAFRQDITDSIIRPAARDTKLREHSLNAVILESGKVVKPKRNRTKKIDRLMAAMLANGARRDILAQRAAETEAEKNRRVQRPIAFNR